MNKSPSSVSPLTMLGFIQRNLMHHARIHLAVALGVAAATAVLTGALLVGDSVRGSLRSLTLERLGRIDEALVADRFFREALASELQSADGFSKDYESATAVILFPEATIERDTDDEQTIRAGQVLVLGGGEDFWKLGTLSPKQPGRDEIVLNEALASDLGITRADLEGEGIGVKLRFPKPNQVPAENPLGKKDDTIRTLTDVRVVDIVPNESIGRFSLTPNQSVPRNAFVAAETLQRALDQKGKVNAIFVTGKSSTIPPDAAASNRLAELFEPQFADYGFILKHARQTFQPTNGQATEIFDYQSFSTDRMIMTQNAVDVATETLASEHPEATAAPVLTYLANAIGIAPESGELSEDEGIPYSTLAAIDIGDAFPLKSVAGDPIAPLADNEIVINSWAAKDLEAKVGDTIRVLYFAPETVDGNPQELSADFVLKAITPLTQPAKPFGEDLPPEFNEPPTLANDPDLTPFVPGVTDTESIEDWDLPFAMTRQIRGHDDQYWSNHRTTPKAFISLASGRKLWGSRFGETTSLRLTISETDADAFESAFVETAKDKGEAFGLKFIPLKRKQLAASAGATPFDVLFLALSMFIIASAIILTALLFRLGLEQRASEIGVLLSCGLRQRSIAFMLAIEGAVVALAGGAVGVLIGIGYAWLMIFGLKTIWVGAVVTPFLTLHISPLSLAIGLMAGVLISLATIAYTLWNIGSVGVRRLLGGSTEPEPAFVTRHRGWFLPVVIFVLLVSAVGLSGLAAALGGEAQAGAFMGSGAAVLLAGILFVWRRMYAPGDSEAIGLPGLAAYNAQRNPGRSVLSIGLIAVASFLIVAVSSFHLAPSENGVGGFQLIAESSQPIFASLNSEDGRDELLGRDAEKVKEASIISLRLKPGDDASCNNLYQAAQPRVLGVTREMIDHFNDPETPHFEFAAHAPVPQTRAANPWSVLLARRKPDEPVPVVIDKNTAMYSLKLYSGVGEEFTIDYEDRPPVRFRVAGLLSNSVLQGSLLISEDDFKRLYPEVSGYRMFLIRAPEPQLGEVAAVLEDRLGDQGFDASSTRDLLRELLAVQNTYLSTFQSLGGLGLLLGVFGLAAVQLRSVIERRGELALLRATGFTRSRLANLVMFENAVLLLLGLAVGGASALTAVAPHMAVGGASVPVVILVLMLVAITAAGIVTGLIAVRATLNAPLLEALR